MRLYPKRAFVPSKLDVLHNLNLQHLPTLRNYTGAITIYTHIETLQPPEGLHAVATRWSYLEVFLTSSVDPGLWDKSFNYRSSAEAGIRWLSRVCSEGATQLVPVLEQHSSVSKHSGQAPVTSSTQPTTPGGVLHPGANSALTLMPLGRWSSQMAVAALWTKGGRREETTACLSLRQNCTWLLCSCTMCGSQGAWAPGSTALRAIISSTSHMQAQTCNWVPFRSNDKLWAVPNSPPESKYWLIKTNLPPNCLHAHLSPDCSQSSLQEAFSWCNLKATAVLLLHFHGFKDLLISMFSDSKMWDLSEENDPLSRQLASYFWRVHRGIPGCQPHVQSALGKPAVARVVVGLDKLQRSLPTLSILGFFHSLPWR